MRVYVNGAAHECADGATVVGLLEQLELKGPVAVEVDGEIVARADRASFVLSAEAKIEIVHFVGGG